MLVVFIHLHPLLQAYHMLISGLHIGADEDSSPLKFYDVLTGKHLLMFQGIAMPSSSESSSSRRQLVHEVEALQSFKTSANIWQSTQRNITDDSNIRVLFCSKIGFSNNFFCTRLVCGTNVT